MHGRSEQSIQGERVKAQDAPVKDAVSEAVAAKLDNLKKDCCSLKLVATHSGVAPLKTGCCWD